MLPNVFAPAGGLTPYNSAVPNNQQVVLPQITIPQMPQMQQTMVQGPQVIRIKGGSDAAKQFPTAANASYALFEEDDDVFWFKQTDRNNFPIVLERYRFFQEDEPVPVPPEEMVTKSEYNALLEEVKNLREEIRNAQQPVSKQNGGQPNGSGNAAAGNQQNRK